MDQIDSYAQFLHTRHWVTSSPKKINSKTKAVKKKKPLPCQAKFNDNVIDTFCFHWPDMHSYVLVRVLEETIAILPVRSRIAFLYFHHAPFPTHPSPRELRRALHPSNNLASKRIHDIFKNWKYTLVLSDEEEEDDDEVDIENNILTTPVSFDSHTLNTPPSTPQEYSGVTLSDVLSYERNLNQGWIHAPCTVKDGDENSIILTTQHTVLCLTSRCFYEKMMFLNLVKFKQTLTNKDDDDDDKTQIGDDKTKNNIMEYLQIKTTNQMDDIEQLTFRIDAAKRSISHYTEQLLELEQSMEILLENINNTIQYNQFSNNLDIVNGQLKHSVDSFHSYRERVSQLQESVSVHSAFLTSAKQRLEQFKSKVLNHAWYPYTSLTGLVLVISFILGYYFYVNLI